MGDRRHELPGLIFTELIQRGNWDMMDELIAPGFVSTGFAGAANGPHEFRALIERWRTAFPDMDVRIADLVVDGDRAAWRVEGSGTQTGPLATPMGEVPPTGKRARFGGIDFGRIGADGRAVEHSSGPDIGLMMTDLGLAPPQPAPPAPTRPAPASGRGVTHDEAAASITAVFDVINSDTYAGLEDRVHPDYVDHSPIGEVQGYDGFRTLLDTFRGAIDGFRAVPEGFVVEGTRAAWRTHLTGVHSGELMGVPATGNAIDVYSHEFGRLAADGRAAEHWTSMDAGTFMRQLGLFVGADA